VERLVLGDSMYSYIFVLRPECRNPVDVPSDTIQFSSSYRVRGDTLTLFTGEGADVEEWYNGRLYPDSVVQTFVERDQGKHYARRRAASRRATVHD
jgi:hypothetical protein